MIMERRYSYPIPPFIRWNIKKAMKRLSEIAKKHSVLSSQIMYYIRIGLIKPSNRTQGGFYLFDEKDEATLDKIFALKKQGLTLKQIKEILESEEENK